MDETINCSWRRLNAGTYRQVFLFADIKKGHRRGNGSGVSALRLGGRLDMDIREATNSQIRAVDSDLVRIHKLRLLVRRNTEFVFPEFRPHKSNELFWRSTVGYLRRAGDDKHVGVHNYDSKCGDGIAQHHERIGVHHIERDQHFSKPHADPR